MSQETREACCGCDKPEPEDNEYWKEAPSGNIYCPECFHVLFERGLAPLLVPPEGEA